MFLQILSSSIFLPLVVASMIVAQIHLENYQNDDIKIHHKKYLSNFYIVFIYLAQEICIIELTLQNINVIAFTFIIPITMILRNRNKLWWGLLAITPTIIVIMNTFTFSQRYQYIYRVTNLLEPVLIAAVCFILLHWNKTPYYIKYTIALYANFFIHVLVSAINHHLKLDFIISYLLGNCFIILMETSRHHYELKQKEEIANLQYENVRDDLTGLLNYRAFDQDMRNLAREKDSTPVLLAILDLDHFKNVNDTYGHLNGNVVLRAFSRELSSKVHHNFGPNCEVYRFGGEEFTIIVKDDSYAKVIKLLNNLNEYFASHPVKTPDGQQIYFSFSGGLTRHLEDETFNQTLARADTLVYQAKNLGRRRILYKSKTDD